MIKCPKCGEDNKNAAIYCNSCGYKIVRKSKGSSSEKSIGETPTNFKSLKCQECGQTMNIESDGEILCCPYCGSKQIVVESEETRLEKYRIDNSSNLKLEKMKHEAEEKRRFFLFSGLSLGGIFLAVILLAIVLTIADHVNNTDIQKSGGTLVKSSCSSSELEGADLEEVKVILEGDGFSNITVLGTDPGFFSSAESGTVKEVSIDGYNMTKGTKYSADDQVVITYYK